MLDKVGLLEKKICQQEMELELTRQEKDIESRTLTSLRQETTTKIDTVSQLLCFLKSFSFVLFIYVDGCNTHSNFCIFKDIFNLLNC